MTDAEISRRLALAIGWNESDFVLTENGVFWCHRGIGWWQRFDYRDPAVIWPIAERFDCFPDRVGNEWASVFHGQYEIAWADTAAKAVALAVIKAKEQK